MPRLKTFTPAAPRMKTLPENVDKHRLSAFQIAKAVLSGDYRFKTGEISDMRIRAMASSVLKQRERLLISEAKNEAQDFNAYRAQKLHEELTHARQQRNDLSEANKRLRQRIKDEA